MAIQDKITQIWVKTTGKRINPLEFEWLIGPAGNSKLIKDEFIVELAEKENLKIDWSQSYHKVNTLRCSVSSLKKKDENIRVQPVFPRRKQL